MYSKKDEPKETTYCLHPTNRSSVLKQNQWQNFFKKKKKQETKAKVNRESEARKSMKKKFKFLQKIIKLANC